MFVSKREFPTMWLLAIVLGVFNWPVSAQRSTPVTVINANGNPVPVVIQTPSPPPPPEDGAIFVHIEGVEGTATQTGVEGWIEASSIAFDVDRPVTTPTGSSQERESGTPRVSDIVIMKNADQTSPKLFELAAVGTSKLVKINFFTTATDSPMVYLELILEDSLISKYDFVSEGGRPMESVSFNFTKIEMYFRPIDANGQPGAPIPACYDIALGRRC